ncbi:unnamed protein product, partial [Mesorhabditis spiculigera]
MVRQYRPGLGTAPAILVRSAGVITGPSIASTPNLGARDLTTSPSTTSAAKAATSGEEAIGLTDATTINPSGGPLSGNPPPRRWSGTTGHAAKASSTA